MKVHVRQNAIARRIEGIDTMGTRVGLKRQEQRNKTKKVGEIMQSHERRTRDSDPGLSVRSLDGRVSDSQTGLPAQTSGKNRSCQGSACSPLLFPPVCLIFPSISGNLSVRELESLESMIASADFHSAGVTAKPGNPCTPSPPTPHLLLCLSVSSLPSVPSSCTCLYLTVSKSGCWHASCLQWVLGVCMCLKGRETRTGNKRNNRLQILIRDSCVSDEETASDSRLLLLSIL